MNRPALNHDVALPHDCFHPVVEQEFDLAVEDDAVVNAGGAMHDVGRVGGWVGGRREVDDAAHDAVWVDEGLHFAVGVVPGALRGGGVA